MAKPEAAGGLPGGGIRRRPGNFYAESGHCEWGRTLDGPHFESRGSGSVGDFDENFADLCGVFGWKDNNGMRVAGK